MGRILDYKGFAVVVDEHSGVFFAYSIDHTTHTYGPDEIAEASNLPDLKSKLDQISKGSLGQTCLILARYLHSNSEDQVFFKGKVTSIKEESSLGTTFRVAFKEGDHFGRQELHAGQIFKDNEPNQKIMLELQQIEHEVTELEKRREALTRTLEPFTEKELQEASRVKA
ncbi:MAG: hypothetical protein WCC94_03050 [Candidatus Bathyarchaeia archaeon]